MDETPKVTVVQVTVSLCDLWLDFLLIAAAVIVPVVCFLSPAPAARADWFQRSGAVVVLLAGVLAYMSLGRHYKKAALSLKLGQVRLTSKPQKSVDLATLALSIVGTFIWGYGDKLIKLLTS